MAKLLEILPLGIQNSKNVMFWLILRKTNNYPLKSFISPISRGFPAF